MVLSTIRQSLFVLPVLILTVAISSAMAVEANYGLDSSSKMDTVRFSSRAKLEFIEGTTTQISGYLRFDPEHTSDRISGILEVDLVSLNTGIDVRDEHMRERHLQTDLFPKSWFKLASVSGLPEKLQFDTTYSARASGAFYLHGICRQVEARLTVSRILIQLEESLSVTASFEIKLSDFGIKHPRALFMKLAKVIDIEVTFQSKVSDSVDSIELPQWEEKN